MALLGKNKRAKITMLANNNVDMWRKYDGLTLLEVDAKESLVDIKIGTSNDIENLVLEFKDKLVAFPFSRNFDTTDLADDNVLANSVFYVRRKMADGDEPGTPTGPEYISFGKPSGITFETLSSLVKAEPVSSES